MPVTDKSWVSRPLIISHPMSEYKPLDYDAPDQPSFLLMLTNDSDYMSPHYFSPNNNTHLDNPRRSRPSLVVSNYLSPPIPSSPLLTFHPSHRLSVNFSQTGIPHLFPKSQRPNQTSPRLLISDDQQQQQQQDIPITY